MSKFSELKKGDVLSETSFYNVVSVDKNNVVVNIDGTTDEVTISKEYVEALVDSAQYVTSEEKKTMTELIEIIKENPRKAMEVVFIKQATPKTQKAYKAEVEAKVNAFKTANIASIEGLVMDLINNPLSKEIPGEQRTMIGRHHGFIDEKGRVHFIDMKIAYDANKPDSRLRQIDTRTIQSIIVNNTKYVLKK